MDKLHRILIYYCLEKRGRIKFNDETMYVLTRKYVCSVCYSLLTVTVIYIILDDRYEQINSDVKKFFSYVGNKEKETSNITTNFIRSLKLKHNFYPSFLLSSSFSLNLLFSKLAFSLMFKD